MTRTKAKAAIEKKRKLAKAKYEADKEKQKRLREIRKKARTKTKSYGKFDCQTVKPGKYAKGSVEITDVGYKNVGDNYIERCGDADFLDSKGVLSKGTCYGMYGHKMHCVGFKRAGSDSLKSQVLFENAKDQDKFFSIANKSLDAWKKKFSESLKKK